MRHLPRIVVIASLLAGLPVQAAEWPPGVRDTFHKSCVESAGQPLGQERAQRYCQCTVARIDRDFSASEVDFSRSRVACAAEMSAVITMKPSRTPSAE